MLFERLAQLTPVMQGLLGTLFTWALTAAGAAIVLFTKRMNRKLLDTMLGFAGGVMIAASFWSLLSPAIEMAEEISPLPPFIVAGIGFILGGLAIFAIDRTLPHLHPGLADQPEMTEGIKTTWRRSILLVLAITMHNFPEGLAVGVAFGASNAGFETASLAGAVALAVGIGIQNLPEGMAVSMPLRGEGLSRWKAFLWGQSSGMVEPIAGVLGALAVVTMQPILPYALAFAAGAMIYVVVEELIPESHSHGNGDLATLGTMAGFVVMMLLDVALG